MTARVCVACRHPLPRDVPCDQPGHEVVDLDPADELAGLARDILIEQTWGPRAEQVRRRQLIVRRRQRTTAAGLSAGGITSVLAIAAGAGPLFYVAGAVAGLVAATAAAIVQPHREDLRFPIAAAALPALPHFAAGTIVDAGDDLRSPASGLYAAGWAVQLTLARPGGPRVVFRDAATSGLEIELDGGERARVPFGPWRPGGALLALRELDEPDVNAYLRRIDASYRPQDPFAPFHHDAVHEELLHVGDRVELFGTWHAVPDPQAGDDPLYRDAPATVRVPIGWPTLRRLRA
jgi:hypothetical protein